MSLMVSTLHKFAIMPPFNITGYSTALFSTWYFVDELRLLFDAGDGLSAALLQKGRRVKHIFISHPDRDHLGGLFQFHQLNAREDWPRIYYPKDSRSFPFMQAFLKSFDPHVSGAIWQPIEDGETIWIGKGIGVEAIRNEHIPAPPGVSKSFGFKVFEKKQKLHPDLQGLPAEQIQKIVLERGKDQTTVSQRIDLLAYSGDTPIGLPSLWQGVKTLIHEATFLENEGQVLNSEHLSKHSTLEQVLNMVAQTDVEQLILGHFSTRYDAAQIDERIQECIQKLGIKIPVHRILPGQVAVDILQKTPIS
jgi:ribonuclease Z